MVEYIKEQKHFIPSHVSSFYEIPLGLPIDYVIKRPGNSFATLKVDLTGSDGQAGENSESVVTVGWRVRCW